MRSCVRLQRWSASHSAFPSLFTKQKRKRCGRLEMHSDEEVTETILHHLAEIGAGRCSINDTELSSEPDPELRQILAAILMCHEDLMLSARERETAETERQHALERLTRLASDLEQAVATRDDFLAVASH